MYRVEHREIHAPLHAVYDGDGNLVAAFADPEAADAFAWLQNR